MDFSNIRKSLNMEEKNLNFLSSFTKGNLSLDIWCVCEFLCVCKDV